MSTTLPSRSFRAHLAELVGAVEDVEREVGRGLADQARLIGGLGLRLDLLGRLRAWPTRLKPASGVKANRLGGRDLGRDRPGGPAERLDVGVAAGDRRLRGVALDHQVDEGQQAGLGVDQEPPVVVVRLVESEDLYETPSTTWSASARTLGVKS